MDAYTPTFEHIVIKGNKTSIRWIINWLMNHSTDFTYDAMTGFLTFVQACYEHEETPIQTIIMTCPAKGWDIVSQFQCSYGSILNQ